MPAGPVGLAAAFLVGVAGAAHAAPPPASAFGRLPDVQIAAISPDGTRVAILGGPMQARSLTISTIDGGKPVTSLLGEVTVRTLHWAGDYVLLRTSAFDTWRTPVTNDVISAHFDRDVVMDRQGKVVGRLLSNSSFSNFATYLPILHVVDAPQPTAFVQGFDWSAGQGAVRALWQVDVATGRGKMVERGQRETARWDVDATGEARVRIDFDGLSDTRTYLGRAKGSSQWKILHRESDGPENWIYLGYSDPDDSLLLWRRDDGAQTGHVVRQSLATGATTVAEADPAALSADLEWEGYTKAPIAVRTEADRPTWRWLDAELGAVHVKLQHVFKTKDVWLRDWSKDRTRFVVEVEARDAPPAWYLFDAKLSQLSPIGEGYPELQGRPLGKTSWITYTAADGLTIPAYLTLPPGTAAGGKPPLIVMPHGGPASRDGFGFDWWAQFLAARGYAVLQPQFRGSRGFGPAFERAGDKEWGGKIQTDLLDGVSYLAGQGTIDPGRVCIVGASFGGYAALAGATLHPEVYRCAVSVAGISDLLALAVSVKVRGGERAFEPLARMTGQTHADRDLLTAISPARQVDKLRGAVLLVHGEQDTTVPYAQSTAMKTALEKAGKPFEFVTLKGDDHYLSSAATRTAMLEAVGDFLDRNLPVDTHAGGGG